MRKREEEDADVEARIAQIEQTTLEQIAVFQGRILADITKGRVAPREASALDLSENGRRRSSRNCDVEPN